MLEKNSKKTIEKEEPKEETKQNKKTETKNKKGTIGKTEEKKESKTQKQNKSQKENEVKKEGNKTEKESKIKKEGKKKIQEKSKKEIQETKKEIEKEEKKEKNKKALVVQKDIEIDQTKLEKIEEEIKKQTTISKEKKQKINKKIFTNILIAIIVVLYFIFLNLGFHNLKPSVFLQDLQVFSILTIGLTIVIFEKAYKKDSGELTIYGIEVLVLAICTLMTIKIGANYKEKFTSILNSISMLFAIYYVGKSIVIYHKMTKKALKKVSDIRKIRRIKE